MTVTCCKFKISSAIKETHEDFNLLAELVILFFWSYSGGP